LGSIDQTHLDIINAGAGQGVIMALEPLLNLQYYGILPQSLFSLAQYQFQGASNGNKAKLWGAVVDMGGATNNMRPAFLGVSLVNQSIIGPMYSCPINNNATYNFAGSVNGSNPIPAFSNVPSLYAFCFENGNARSVVLINTDLTASHTISFAGTNTPAGAVTQRQFAPASLDDLNEAHTGTASNQTAATVAIETSSLSSPSSITLPPHSVTALDYITGGQAAAAEPTFTPAGGTYASAQTVTLSDATSGATIYYTTNGTTPTTSSAVYSSPITVSATETLNAIAVETGYAHSAVATAAYTVSSGTLPAPTITPAGGTYTASQTVSISDATAGTTIYYTTDGTTPTTSSNKYSSAITVSASKTLKAIAAETGHSNSPAAAAAYNIETALPAPAFSPAGGTYTASQTVSISDATAGTTIYYTTNGSTPTTSSAVYSGPITVSATETLEAIAVEAGYSNSPVASANYSIGGAATAKKTPKLKATPSSSQVSTDEPLAVAVSVSGDTGQSTPTGTVIVTTESYSSPATAVNNGNATINIPAGSLTPGKHTLTVNFTPDGASVATCTSASTAVPVTVGEANYSLAATGVTVAPGASGTSTVTVSSTSDFEGTVTLSCAVTSSPADATDLPSCIANKAVKLDSNNMKETTTVTVDTTPNSSAQMMPQPGNGRGWSGAGQGAVLALLVFLGIPARRRKWQAMLCALIMVAAMGGLVGCGGLVMGKSVPTSHVTNPGTTAGTYTFTVTGTGNDSAQTTATTTFTLTVN